MKTKWFFITIVLLSLPMSSFSKDYYLYVYTVNENLKPNILDEGKSNDEVLNEIFKNFGVYSYYQSFPGAKTPELLNYYEIHFKGNVDSLEDLLRERNLFEKIYRSDVYELASITPKQGAKSTVGLTIRQNTRMLRIIVHNRGADHHSVALYDLTGRHQSVLPVYHADGTISVSLSNVAMGSYVFRVQDGKNAWSRKVLVR